MASDLKIMAKKAVKEKKSVFITRGLCLGDPLLQKCPGTSNYKQIMFNLSKKKWSKDAVAHKIFHSSDFSKTQKESKEHGVCLKAVQDVTDTDRSGTFSTGLAIVTSQLCSATLTAA